MALSMRAIALIPLRTTTNYPGQGNATSNEK